MKFKKKFYFYLDFVIKLISTVREKGLKKIGSRYLII
jgi:hypothetical protein